MKFKKTPTMQSKTTLFGILVLLIMTFTIPLDTMAQNKGKGGPPSWAPANGYRAKTKHIYFPDNNFYYDIEKNVYIYMNGDHWQISAKLPSIYATIDLRGALMVELALNTNTPQNYNAEHLIKYKGKSKKTHTIGKSGKKGKGKGKKK